MASLRATTTCRLSSTLVQPQELVARYRPCLASQSRRRLGSLRQASASSAESQTQKQAGEPRNPSSSSSTMQANCPFDTNYWHYSRSFPWWQQRAFLVPAGISFVILANLLEGPGIKTTLIASIPVALLWYLSLYLVPKNFATYCKQWASTHPEEAERAN